MTSVAAFLDSISFWYWLAFGIFLMFVEVLVPGVFFLWLGVAAVITGLAVAAIPSMSWEIQLVVFALLSVASIVLGRRFVYARQSVTDHPMLNRRGETFVGQQYTLSEPTTDGHGRLHIGDTTWAVRVAPSGRDLAAGVRVRVIGMEGATLLIEAAA